jgi:hypothetical protein
MLFNLARAIVMSYERQGEAFPQSVALTAMINERVDRLGRQLAEQTEAKELHQQISNREVGGGSNVVASS